MTNAYVFNFCDATWVEHEPVRFWRFCEALVKGEAIYGYELSGGWHRKSCDDAATLHQRATQELQNMQRDLESLDQQACAARNKLRRAQTLVDDLTRCLATLSTLDLSQASDVDRLRSLSLAKDLVPEVVRATSVVWERRFRWPRALLAFSDRLAKRRDRHDRLTGIQLSAARLAKRRIAEWPRAELADCSSSIERLKERRSAVSSAQLELKRALVAGDQDEVERLLCDAG